MPDGTTVDMPDQLDEATGKRLRAFLSDQQDKQDAAKNAAAAPHSFEPDAAEQRQQSPIEQQLEEHPVKAALTTGAGMLENAVSGVTGAVGRTYGRVRNIVTGRPVNENLPDTAYEPRTDMGQAIAQQSAQEGEKIGSGYDTVFGTGPGATTIKENAPAVMDTLNTGAMALGAPGAVRGVARVVGRAADVGVNAAVQPSAAAGETVASNPAIANTRAAGFRLTGGDVRNSVNGPEPGIPPEVPGSTRQAIAGPGAIEANQRFNRALSTQKMTQDVGLDNTRAIDPDELSVRRQQEGAVYDEIGQAVGRGRTPSPQLDNELQGAGQRAASETGRQMVDSQVQFYRDQFKDGFSGPDAVQDVRTLRQQAYKQMANDNPDTQVLGATNREIANSIENELMRQVPVQNTSLLERFPQARQQLAKIHELDAVSEQGQVVPSLVKRLQDNGAPLSGGAKEVADAYGAAPESMTIGPNDPGRTPLPVSHYGTARAVVDVGRGLVRHLPGMDPTTEAFQEANYGPSGKSPAAPQMGPPTPAPPLQMSAPPGQVGRAPPAQGELPMGPPVNPAVVERVSRGQPPEAGRTAPTARSSAPPPGATEHTSGPYPPPPSTEGESAPYNEEMKNATRGFLRQPAAPGKNLTRKGFDEETLRRLRERGGG
jgi:hypothetical protein